MLVWFIFDCGLIILATTAFIYTMGIYEDDDDWTMYGRATLRS